MQRLFSYNIRRLGSIHNQLVNVAERSLHVSVRESSDQIFFRMTDKMVCKMCKDASNKKAFAACARSQLPSPVCRPYSSSAARVLDGKRLAAVWSEEAQAQVAQLKATHGVVPGLAVVVVGQRADSLLYVWRKREACMSVGINFFCANLPEDVTAKEVQATLRSFERDPQVHGVLVQLPLPPQLKAEVVCEWVPPFKDVDALHPCSLGRLLLRGTGERAGFVPCTAQGCVELLRLGNVDVRDKKVVVLGNSNTVGTPLALMLRDQGASQVTMFHEAVRWPAGSYQARSESFGNVFMCPTSRDKVKIPEHVIAATREADLVVAAVGVPNLVRGSWIKEGATVIDVGVNLIPPTNPGEYVAVTDTPSSFSELGFQIVGDVDFDEVQKVASVISPVPGGVGPMTIAALLHNVVHACRIALHDPCKG